MKTPARELFDALRALEEAASDLRSLALRYKCTQCKVDAGVPCTGSIRVGRGASLSVRSRKNLRWWHKARLDKAREDIRRAPLKVWTSNWLDFGQRPEDVLYEVQLSKLWKVLDEGDPA